MNDNHVHSINIDGTEFKYSLKDYDDGFNDGRTFKSMQEAFCEYRVETDAAIARIYITMDNGIKDIDEPYSEDYHCESVKATFVEIKVEGSLSGYKTVFEAAMMFDCSPNAMRKLIEILEEESVEYITKHIDNYHRVRKYCWYGKHNPYNR